MGIVTRRDMLAGIAVAGGVGVIGGVTAAAGGSASRGIASTSTAAAGVSPSASSPSASSLPTHEATHSAVPSGTAYRLAPIDNSADGVKHAGKPSGDRTVWLTFDDGGDREQVTTILRELAAANVLGVFFPLGQFAADEPDLIRRMKDEGHYVGNHSYSHPDVSRLSDSRFLDQVLRADAAIGPNTFPKLFRCPYGNGAYSRRINRTLTNLGYQNCYWTCDTVDWSGVPAQMIVRRAVEGDAATPPGDAGGVVLMHMSGKHTGAALPQVIEGLRARGLRLPTPGS